jgi:hypothetical protein
MTAPEGLRNRHGAKSAKFRQDVFFEETKNFFWRTLARLAPWRLRNLCNARHA